MTIKPLKHQHTLRRTRRGALYCGACGATIEAAEQPEQKIVGLPPMRASRWWEDGYPHERDENGTCRNCGAASNQYHAALKGRP